jgi:uroporphyrin-III C-methyltransferase/precorrin-2 dehydrogenase/sirohydrochlorin ferrochelatase
MAALFPMFLRLEGRKCLLVGGGRIAEQKLDFLLEARAAVTVVAPEASESLHKRIADGQIAWRRRRFEELDLCGAVLVIAATGDPAVNESIYNAADAVGILCNAVDEPAHCHFYYPAVLRRGDLQIAISTNGRSPALAQRIRKELEEQYDESYGDWLDWLGQVRSLYLRLRIETGCRVHALHQIARREVYERYRAARSSRGALLTKSAEDGVAAAEVRHGKVFLVGAGPGDPELLAVKAARLLSQADVVLHDALVGSAILKMVHPEAALIDVGKRCGQKLLTQQEINSLLIAYAQKARTVVRLKGGDPGLFGRAGEEIEALTGAGIAFEIVPGITAALAGAAAAGISLTDRRSASSVVFTTGHRKPGAEKAEWDKLVTSGSTLAIYMPGSDYAQLAGELRDAGVGLQIACTVISAAGSERQQILCTDLAGLFRNNALPSPAVIIVGACARAAASLDAPAVREPYISRQLIGEGQNV